MTRPPLIVEKPNVPSGRTTPLYSVRSRRYVVRVGGERGERLAVVAEQAAIERAEQQLRRRAALERQQHLHALVRELLAAGNQLQAIADHPLQPDALLVDVVASRQQERVQEAARAASRCAPAIRLSAAGSAGGVRSSRHLSRLEVDALRRDVHRPDVVERAVLWLHVLQQRHVVQLLRGRRARGSRSRRCCQRTGARARPGRWNERRCSTRCRSAATTRRRIGARRGCCRRTSTRACPRRTPSSGRWRRTHASRSRSGTAGRLRRADAGAGAAAAGGAVAPRCCAASGTSTETSAAARASGMRLCMSVVPSEVRAVAGAIGASRQLPRCPARPR